MVTIVRVGIQRDWEQVITFKLFFIIEVYVP